MRDREFVFEYWKNPRDGNNWENYRYNKENAPKTVTLGEVFKEFIPRDYSILELGCNVGRNLYYLSSRCGYNGPIYGIEINKEACDNVETKECTNVTIINNNIESALKNLPIKPDVIFTMAVLEHIHPDSNFIFDLIQNQIKPKFIITIEDEKTKSERHFPRNYCIVFNQYKQLYRYNCMFISGLNKDFFLRVFKAKE